MAGVLVLTAEEAGLVVSGGFNDPTLRARDYDDYSHDEELLEPEVAEDDEERVHPSFEAVDRQSLVSRRFERLAEAAHWRRHAHESVVLLARTATGADLAVVAVAAAAGGPRLQPADTGLRRIIVGPWVRTTRPVELTEVLTKMAARSAGKLREVVAGPARPLPPVTGSELTRALSELLPSYPDVVESLAVTPRPRATDPMTYEQRDAVISALRIFTGQWRQLEPVENPARSEMAETVDDLLAVHEADLISDDAAVLPGWERAQVSAGGWWEFRHRNRQMLIKNINAQPAEAATGADLVYLSREPDSVVVVQYKLVEVLPSSGRQIYRLERRLAEQVAKMRRLERSVVPQQSLAGYRLGPGFTFVKLLHPVTALRRGRDELVPGRYFPSELMGRLLRAPDAGPRGGKLIYVDDHRSMDAETFVRLVRDTWVGSVGDVFQLIPSLMRRAGVNAASITVAIDEPAQ